MVEAEDETAAHDETKQSEFTNFILIQNNSEVLDYSQAEKRPQILAALTGLFTIYFILLLTF